MTKQVQLRRGTTAEHAVFTGAVGELTIDTSKDIAVVHDGVTVGGHELVGVAATGQSIVNKDAIGIGTSVAPSALTVEGDTRVSGVSTVGQKIVVGTSNTLTTLALDVVGNSRVTGLSSVTGNFDVTGNVSVGGSVIVGGNTLIIDGSTNTIKGPSNTLDFNYTGVSTFNNIEVLGYGLTTSSVEYTVVRSITGFGNTVIGLTTTAGISKGDFISISGVTTNSEIVDIVSITTSFYNRKKVAATISKPVSVGSTIIGLSTAPNVAVGDSITIDGTYSYVPIVGVTTVQLDPLDQLVITTSTFTGLSTQISAGSTIIGLANIGGVSIGNSITIFGSGSALDYSNNPNSPTVVQYSGNSLNIQNSVGAGDTDYVTFTVQNSSITNLFLTRYVSSDPISFFAIQEGSTYTAGIDTTQMVTYGHFGPGVSGKGVGQNILGGAVLGVGNTYTMWINQTNPNASTEYVFSTNVGYTGTAFGIFDRVPIVGFTSIAKAPVYLPVVTTSISTTVSAGSTIIGLDSISNVSVGNSISIQGFFEYVRIVGFGTVALGIATDAPTGPAVLISTASTIGSSIPTGTGATVYNVQTTQPAVLIGAGFTYSLPIQSGLGVTITEVIPQSGPAVLIGAANTSSSSISVGTAASISEFTDKLNTVLVGFANSINASVTAGTISTVTKVSPPKSNINVNNFKSVGITTLEQLILNGLRFPTVDGSKGQVIVTDGEGNLGFSTGGSGGSKVVLKVSAASGDDSNDGRSLPFKTIKKASQVASKVGQPVTIFVETGEYLEDNPIIVYDEVSIIGDSLRNIVVRPLNAGRDLFKVRNGCYISGMSFNDYVDNITGAPQYTYDYAIAFDDPYSTTIDRTGYACTSVLDITNVTYDKATGITTITTSTPHELYRGNTVRLAGIAMTCGYDEVGINTFVYNNSTGISTITVFQMPTSLAIGNELYLNNLPFTCAAQHAGVTTTIFPYPGLDPIYGAVYPITGINTAAKTITIAGAASTIPHVYEGYPTVAISTFSYNHVLGIATATTSSPHGLVANDRIALAGLAFTCPGGSGITTTIFPDGTITDYSYDGYTFRVDTVLSPTSFTYYVGVSTISHTYVSGGSVRKVPTIQEAWRYPEKLSSGRVDFGVIKAINEYTFVVKGEPFVNGNFEHYYTQDGTARFSKPLINKSPYIQNCSILSSLGGNGILVDGNKVVTQNQPLIPELGEIPVVGDQPEFGKSMVAATFTMVSFGGIGWRTINDGYAQVVSCFQIFCKYASLTQSGGYLSITNSATNFGNYSLRSTGFSPNAFSFDRGRVVSTGTRDGLQTLKVVGLGRSDQDLYVLRFLDNEHIDRTSNFKPLVVTQEFTGGQISTITGIFNIPTHPFQNGDSIVYQGNENTEPQQVIDGLVSGNQYYVQYIDASNFRLYEDDSLETLASIGSTFVGINTLTKNNQEFFVKEIIGSHNSYQVVSLASTSSTLKFNSGQIVTQSVTGGTATGYALTFNPTNRQLVLSVEEIGGVRRNFAANGNPILDHSTPTAVSIAITSVAGITSYITLDFKVDSTNTGTVISGVASLPINYNCYLHRPSIINSSAHTWEYSGSGTDYNALPQNGGQTKPGTEQVSELGGRVYASGTNELGDFKIGDQITAFNRTGNIIFNNKVTIGELASIRLSLSGGVAVEEFSTDVGLGENEVGGPKNSRVSTQLAVRSFLGNRLGTFIDKTVSANAIPNAVVQLNSAGQINADLIPPKVVNYVIAGVDTGRTVLVNKIPAVNILQGDTVVEPSDSFVLVNDVVSQYLILDSSTEDYVFANGNEVVSALTKTITGVVTAPPQGVGIGSTIVSYVGYGTTGLVKGVMLGLTISQTGSGYNQPGIYTGLYLNSVTGVGTSAIATITIGAGGSVSAISVNAGGKGYAVGDVVSINDANTLGGRTGGSNFQATVNTVETRLYLKLTNNQKFAGSSALADFIQDGSAVSISTSLTGSDYTVNFNPTDISIGGDVDFANNRIVVGVNSFSSGDPIILDPNSGSLLTASGAGVLALETYYVKPVGAGTSVELHRTYQLNNVVDFDGSGIGTHTLRRNVVNTNKETLVFKSHPFVTGTAVRVSGSTPSGITTGDFYYVGSVTTNSFTLHATQSDSLFSVNGTSFNAIGIGSTHTGTITLTEQNVRYSKTVNTSSTELSNWTLLATGVVDAANIVSGTISPTRLGSGDANSDTFLSGTSEYVKVVKSVGIGTTEPLTAVASSVDFAPGGIGTNKYYGNVSLRVNRAQPSIDTFSTLGVAKFRTSTFLVGSDGEVSIRGSATGDVDAATLGGQGGAYYLNTANHIGAVPVTRGGTGLNGVPGNGAILIGNGSAYNLTTSPIFTGNVTMPKIFIERTSNIASGISWFSSAYTSWATYMAQAGQTSVGPTGNLTAPSGTLVTSWALRNFIENAAGYGWTWESGTSTGQPSVVAEIRSSDGSFRTAGNITAAGNITVGGALVFGTTTFPVPTTSDVGATLRYDDRGIYWDTQQGDVYTGATVVRGYTMGGYKDGVAWTNVNRTDHASQTTYNLGDQVTTIDAYTGASSNGTFAYMFNPGGNWTAQGNQINRFNMLTDSNSDIATTMLTTKDRNSVMRYKFIYAYIFGDNRPEKFIHATETPLLFLGVNDSNGSHGNNPACGQGELRGWHNVSGTRANYLEFATESWNTWGSVPASDGSNKAISSYTGYMYWNTGGGYTTSAAMSKRDDYTGTQILTIGKPGATGEESFHTGELAGYMVGMYNGAQNNQGGLINYTNNAFTFVTSLNSQGTLGRASAAGIEYGRGV